MKRFTVENLVFNILFFCVTIAAIFEHRSEGVMCADFGISAIVAALIAAAATTASGIASNRASKNAGEQSLQLAGIAREDTLKQQKTSNRQNESVLALNRNKFNYEKRLNREVQNKTQIANLGTSLSMLSKSGMDMQSFISSLYGNKSVRAMG
jgi:hypothetical protein